MISWTSDGPEKLTFHVYADSDYAGDAKTIKSTSGADTCFIGGNFNIRPPKTYENSDAAIKNATPEGEATLTKAAKKAIRKKRRRIMLK